MKSILYVDKSPRAQILEDWDRAKSMLSETRQKIEQTTRGKFSVRFVPNFGLHVLSELMDGFDGLLTHFPYSPALFTSGALENLKGEQYFKTLYGNSIHLMRAIRKQFSNLPIVVYTGAGESDMMTKIIVQSGANKVIYRSSDLEDDAKRIHKSLVELIPS